MRYSAPSLTPRAEILEGDEKFVRMNAASARDKLSIGEYVEARNKRIVGGAAKTRGGTVLPTSHNAVAFSQILGSAVYNNPNGDKVILVACPSQVLMLRSGAYPTSVPIPAGVTLSGSISFSQQFSFVLLHALAVPATYVWDGISPDGFVPVVKSVPDNTARDILPDVAWSTNMDGRTIFPVSRDELGATDIGDYSMYDPIFGVFRVNAGTADPIVGAFPFSKSNVLVGKGDSWDVLANFVGDFTDPASADFQNPQMEVLSSTIGLKARLSFQMIGSDAIFLYDHFYRIQQADENRLTTAPLPVGAYVDQAGEIIDTMEEIINRINWAYASGAVSAVLAPYYYCAVPFDGSTVNNAVIVINTVTNALESYDTWDASAGMRIDNLLVADYLGTPHVYAVNHGTNSVHVLYLDTAAEDTTANGEFQISDLLRTRGYADMGRYGSIAKDYNSVRIGLATLRPSITVTQVNDGANNTRVLTSSAITKDRTKYYQWGKPDYVVSNVNGDFAVAGRQDYSVKIDDAFPIDSNISIDLKQERPEKFSLHGRGRWVAFDIENTQGQCDVLGVILDSQPTGEIKRGA